MFSMHFPEGSREQRLFKAQAAEDWEKFLLHRAKELVNGIVLAVGMLIGNILNPHASNLLYHILFSFCLSENILHPHRLVLFVYYLIQILYIYFFTV